MSRFATSLAICVALSLLAAVPAAAEPPTASASATCSVAGRERTFVASYVTKLSTRRVTCANARDFVRRYHRCRHRNGGRRGRCRGVRRFRCEERRYNQQPGLSFDANVLCTRGSQRIRHTYTEIL